MAHPPIQKRTEFVIGKQHSFKKSVCWCRYEGAVTWRILQTQNAQSFVLEKQHKQI